MTDDMNTPPVRKRRWVSVLLFFSLALNLLIAGIVAGVVFLAVGPGKDGRPNGPARSVMGEPYIRALEPQDRRALGREIVSNRDQLRVNQSDIRARIEAMLETLRQEDFDRAALASLLAEQRGLAVSRQEFGEELLLNRLEAMSPDERRAYADRLSESFKKGRRR